MTRWSRVPRWRISSRRSPFAIHFDVELCSDGSASSCFRGFRTFSPSRRPSRGIDECLGIASRCCLRADLGRINCCHEHKRGRPRRAAVCSATPPAGAPTVTELGRYSTDPAPVNPQTAAEIVAFEANTLYVMSTRRDRRGRHHESRVADPHVATAAPGEPTSVRGEGRTGRGSIPRP